MMTQAGLFALTLLAALGCGLVAGPRNEALAGAEPSSAEGAVLWARYLSSWTAWNHVRTAGSLGAMASFILGLCALAG